MSDRDDEDDDDDDVEVVGGVVADDDEVDAILAGVVDFVGESVVGVGEIPVGKYATELLTFPHTTLPHTPNSPMFLHIILLGLFFSNTQFLSFRRLSKGSHDR